MKTTIWARVRGTPDQFPIWTGELALLPRPDDFIHWHPDWGGELVKRVEIMAYENSAEIHVEINAHDAADYPRLDISQI